MKAKEITLWEYTINYFFIAQLLSRQKAAISIVPLNTGSRQNHPETSGEQHIPYQISTKSTGKVKSEGQGAQPPWPYLVLLRPVAMHQTWLDCHQIHGELQRWEMTYFPSKVGVLEAQKSPFKCVSTKTSDTLKDKCWDYPVGWNFSSLHLQQDHWSQFPSPMNSVLAFSFVTLCISLTFFHINTQVTVLWNFRVLMQRETWELIFEGTAIFF